MSKYKFECIHVDGTRITLEVNEVALDEIIQNFEFFLKGCGFSIDGKKIEIEEE